MQTWFHKHIIRKGQASPIGNPQALSEPEVFNAALENMYQSLEISVFRPFFMAVGAINIKDLGNRAIATIIDQYARELSSKAAQAGFDITDVQAKQVLNTIFGIVLQQTLNGIDYNTAINSQQVEQKLREWSQQGISSRNQAESAYLLQLYQQRGIQNL